MRCFHGTDQYFFPLARPPTGMVASHLKVAGHPDAKRASREINCPYEKVAFYGINGHTRLVIHCPLAARQSGSQNQKGRRGGRASVPGLTDQANLICLFAYFLLGPILSCATTVAQIAMTQWRVQLSTPSPG